jgi:hypothetical protein
MRKRYITSLKSLLEDKELVSEGFSRLGTVNLRTQSAERCKLDLPQQLVIYLTKFKTLTEIEHDKKEKKLKKPEESKLKSVVNAPIEMFDELASGFFGTAINDRTQFEELQKLVSLLFMIDIPVVYCDVLNMLANKFHNIFQTMGVYKAEEEKEKKPSTKKVNLSIINELNYGGMKEINTLRPRIDLTEYGRLPIIKQNNFLKSTNGKFFGFGLGLFRNFLPNYVSNNEFNSDTLNQDYQEIQQLIESLNRISPNGLSDVYEDAAKEINLNFESYDEFDINFEKYQELDKGSDSDENNAKSFKNIIIVDYVSFLLVIIEKVFYDKENKSTIPQEAKYSLDQIKSLLVKNGASLQRFGLS